MQLFLDENTSRAKQILNLDPPFRFHLHSLGTIDQDLQALSYFFLSSICCSRDYYIVDLQQMYLFGYLIEYRRGRRREYLGFDLIRLSYLIASQADVIAQLKHRRPSRG